SEEDYPMRQPRRGVGGSADGLFDIWRTIMSDNPHAPLLKYFMCRMRSNHGSCVATSAVPLGGFKNRRTESYLRAARSTCLIMRTPTASTRAAGKFSGLNKIELRPGSPHGVDACASVPTEYHSRLGLKAPRRR